jgi:3'-phosphoadenosine 5'-phosphosulfate sulfotransferase (PAPS reductase)/FAD synthetase
VREAGDALFDREGLFGDASSRDKGVPSREAALPGAACGYDLEVPGDDRVPPGKCGQLGLDLIVHTNEDGIRQGINPFSHGSSIYTNVMKKEALRQALDRHGFDAALGGARRDEEKSRAKERIFSFRSQADRWNPKNQRPEPWTLYNTRKDKGESIRVFPLSNWTELDIWQYIYLENIPVVPLYFARERPVVERDGMLIMVDDDRLPLAPGERPKMRKVRFRTLALSADRRDRKRGGDPAGDPRGNAARPELGTPGPPDRS